MSTTKKYATYPSLADRVVVVSGGATGIGASIVEHFVLQGSRVVLLDILEDDAHALIQGLRDRAAAHPPTFFKCDLRNIDGELRPTASKILAEFPKIDVLVNNAARDTRRPTLEISSEQWNDDISVNLNHIFFLTQALMPGLIAAGTSSVINMGSITWAIAGTGLVPYVTSKAAIVGLTKTLAKEFGPRGIRVNSIMPGAIATERQKRDILTPEYEAQVLENQSLKHLMQPDEVARLALWLGADDSSGVTKQSIIVDSGWV